MTLDQIMQDDTLSNLGKAEAIHVFDGNGGPYNVHLSHDVNWKQNGTRFRSLRTAQAYATLIDNADDVDVVDLDGNIYQPGYIPA